MKLEVVHMQMNVRRKRMSQLQFAASVQRIGIAFAPCAEKLRGDGVWQKVSMV